MSSRQLGTRMLSHGTVYWQLTSITGSQKLH
uniref:Uncharacterized protein n=1 Tax=Arundo donax TaxID=35708 RepID=A0A0A9CAK9_ARUDO